MPPLGRSTGGQLLNHIHPASICPDQGVCHAVQLDRVVLVFWAILPLSRLVRRRGWPCAGYSGFVNPSSGVFVCWNKISTHACRRSLGRLLGRAAVMVTRYERIERMGSSQSEPFLWRSRQKKSRQWHQVSVIPRIKRLLRNADDRG